MSLRCFIQTQHPVPGTVAQPVHYPACEWVEEGEGVDLQHPLNRFVCSWLTSDMSDAVTCDTVLHAMEEIEQAARQTWFVDGDAFHVDVHAHGVQFNPSHIGPDDAAYWNQPQAKFSLQTVSTLLRAWRDFLETSTGR